MFAFLTLAAAVTVRRVEENRIDSAKYDDTTPISGYDAMLDAQGVAQVEAIDPMLLDPIQPRRSEEISFAELEGFDKQRTSEWSKKLQTKRTKLGAGTFGTVYLVHPQCEPTAKYALKVQKPQSPSDKAWPIEMNSEVQLMLKFNTPRFVQLLDYGYGKSKMGTRQHSIIMEAADSDLIKYTSKDNSWEQVAVFMADLLDGIFEMHAAKVVHRDLKPGNVLVKCVSGGKCHAKIADLGMSCRLGVDSCGFGGTPLYMAPEYLKEKRPAYSNDIWAMGVMMYELLFKKLPSGIRGRSIDELNMNIRKIKDTSYVSRTEVAARMKGASKEVVETAYVLLKGLLEPVPSMRLPASTAADLALKMKAGVAVMELSSSSFPACWTKEATPDMPVQPKPAPLPVPPKPAPKIEPAPEPEPKKAPVKPAPKIEPAPEPEPEEDPEYQSVSGEEDFVAVNSPKVNVAASYVMKWATGKETMEDIRKTSSKYLPKALRKGTLELIDINGFTSAQIKNDPALAEGLKDGVYGNLVVHVALK